MSRPDIQALEKEIEKINPRFHISEELLPEVKGWKTGEEYSICLKVKQIGKVEDIDMPAEARFEILEAEVCKESEEEEVEFISKTI